MRACTASRHSYAGVIRLADCYFPISFLPAAEDAGLMRPLAARVLDMALTQLRSWRDDGVMVTVAVNLSTTNLLDLGLVASIARLLRTHDLPPESLILEITESTLTTDSQRARNTVAALRRLGTRLSLDDYGTGWSSLARLQDLSVDELKLDQVFVARLALDPRSIAIVRSTVALAHSLGADLVADGVEDDATLRALRQYGCTSHRATCIVLPFPPRRFRSGSRRVAPRRDRGDARGLRAFDRPFADKNRNDGKENETSAILRTWTGERAAKSSHYRGTPSTKCRLESCSSEYPCPPSPLPETAKYCLRTRHLPRWLDTPPTHCSRWRFLSSSGWCQPMSLQFRWSVSTRTSLSS